MKFKVLFSFLALIVTAIVVAAVNVTLTSQNEFSDTAISNIEALADCESSIKTNPDGSITITICNRQDNEDDYQNGIMCSEDADGTCSLFIPPC